MKLSYVDDNELSIQKTRGNNVYICPTF